MFLAMENRYPVKNCSCPSFIYPKSFNLQEISTKKKIDIFDCEWYALR